MKFFGHISARRALSLSWTKKAVIFFLCLLLNLTLTSHAKADEVVVSVNGNGSSSSNQVQVTSQNSTAVSQNNDANVTNNVNSNANTGDNNANSNTGGDSTIKTGDTSSDTSVNNQNINTNSDTSNCACANNSTSITVAGNGNDSTNTVVATNNTTTIVGQSNTAVISNNINVNANTGHNSASYNNGTSTIITGSIYARTNITNKNINNSAYDGPGAVTSSDSVKISGNGEGSFNNAILADSSSVVITNTNVASITNNVEQNLNTGGNTTMGNVGDSVIITGNVVGDVNIDNENINSNFVKTECNCNTPGGDGEHPGGGSTPPSTPGSSTVQGASGSSSSSGSSSGSSNGSVLPATGSSIPYTLIATLILFFMLLTGLYLRLHGANAPPVQA